MNKLFSILALVTFFSTPSFSSSTVCDWDLSTTRRLLRGNDCMDQSKRICSGYVSCEKDGIKTTRLATCSAKNCSNDKATDCALEKNYGSRKPTATQASKNKNQSKSDGTHN
jgi:hypothetical protein